MAAASPQLPEPDALECSPYVQAAAERAAHPHSINCPECTALCRAVEAWHLYWAICARHGQFSEPKPAPAPAI